MDLDRQIPQHRPGEHLVLYLRRHWIYLVWHFSLYAVLALIPVGMYYFFIEHLTFYIENPIVFATLFLLGSVYYLYIVLFFYATFIDYYLDVWIVTNRRIIMIEQKGLFNRTRAEFELSRIQDITAHQQGLLSTFLTYGDIIMQTAGERVHATFKQVDNPFEVQNIIQKLVAECKKHHP